MTDRAAGKGRTPAPRTESPDAGEMDAEYTQGYREGFEDGYERAEAGYSYPTDLMTRRARRRAIETYKKTRKKKE